MGGMQKYRVLAFTDEVKVMWAEKLAAVVTTDEGGVLTLANPECPPFRVSPEYMDKHKPESGGYYIVYQGGHESFCPMKQFETGYAPIEKLDLKGT